MDTWVPKYWVWHRSHSTIDKRKCILSLLEKHIFGCRRVFKGKSKLFKTGQEYKKGETIQPHLHNKQERIVYLTPEFILLKKGKVRVNFFSDKKVLLGNTILNQFDSILLYEGAHSFDILEDMELIEVKQGPYIEENDKIKW